MKLALATALIFAAPDSSARMDSDAIARVPFTHAISTGEEPIFGVSVSRSRGLAVAGRRDGSVAVWDAKGWAEVAHFPAHEGFCYAAVWSPDGRMVATAGFDGAVKLWNAGTWSAERTLRTSGGPVVALAFASGGKRLLAAGADGLQVHVLEGGFTTLRVPASAVAASGNQAASGGPDGVVRIWDLASAKEVRAMPAHGGLVSAVAVQPTGFLVVSGGVDRAIHVWDARTGQRVRTLPGHDAPIRSLTFLPGGSLLVSAAADGVRLWDVSAGRTVRTLAMNGVAACGVSVGLGGRQLVVTGGDNRLWIWGGAGPKQDPPEDARPVGFLGVHYVDGGGALVQGIFPDSPASRTGFQAGDVIVGVDDVTIEKSDDFLNYMRRSHEGDDVTMKVKRGEETRFVRVKLGRWKDQ